MDYKEYNETASMIRAIHYHTEKIISEGPEACRKFLKDAGIQVDPISVTYVYEKNFTANFFTQETVETAMNEWAEINWNQRVNEFTDELRNAHTNNLYMDIILNRLKYFKWK